MARLPRLVLPGIPHHVTQRGNGRAQTFFEDGDYALYLDLLADAARRAQAECLVPAVEIQLRERMDYGWGPCLPLQVRVHRLSDIVQ